MLIATPSSYPLLLSLGETVVCKNRKRADIEPVFILFSLGNLSHCPFKSKTVRVVVCLSLLDRIIQV